MVFVILNLFPAIFWKIWLQMKDEILAPKAQKIFFGTFTFKNIFLWIFSWGRPNHTLALPFSNFPAEYEFILLKIISGFIRTKGMGLIFCILVSSIRTIAPKARKIFGNKPPEIISSTDFIVFNHNLRKIQNHIIKKYFF